MAKDVNLDFLTACLRNTPQAMLHRYGADTLPAEPILVQAEDINPDGEIRFLLPETHACCFEHQSELPVRIHFKDNEDQFHVNVVGMMSTDNSKSREHYYRNSSGQVPVWVTVKIRTADYVEHVSNYSWTTQIKQAWQRVFTRRANRFEWVH